MTGLSELSFVAGFWRLAGDGDSKAQRIAVGIPPEALHDRALSSMYGIISDRMAAGEDVGPSNIDLSQTLYRVGGESAGAVMEAANLLVGFDITPHVRAIHQRYQAERQVQLLEDYAGELRELVKSDPGEAMKRAEQGAMAVLNVAVESASHHAPQTREEISQAELEVVRAGGVRGLTWPYPKMQRILGPILPGRVYGITAFPNCGKSTLLANLFRGFVVRGMPCIVAPTEMRTDWLRRVWAAHADVPQEIAENQLWRVGDDPTMRYLMDLWGCSSGDEVDGILAQHRQRYEDAVRAFEDLDWEVINRSELSVDEILARFRVLRRRYPGQHVIGMIDHMHDLRYRDNETDKHVGAATRKIRDFCKDDPAFSAILLFQPKKAQTEADQFKPIRANEIRGQVAQVLDVHMSIYRRIVHTTAERTPWGTLRAQLNEHGYPERAQPSDPGAKVDDEHVYIKPDKRRIGGEGKSFILSIRAPSGVIYEEPRHRDVRV